MDNSAQHHRFEVIMPVGFVVIAFPNGKLARRAMTALAELRYGADAVRYYSSRDMLDCIEADLALATPLERHGAQMDLARAQRALAERGYHWLLVRARNDGRAFQVADCVRGFGAARAQYFGRHLLEAMIELIDNISAAAALTPPEERGLSPQHPGARELARSRPPQASTVH